MSSTEAEKLCQAIKTGTPSEFRAAWKAMGRPQIPPDALLLACSTGNADMIAAAAECGGRFGLPAAGPARAAYVAQRFEARMLEAFRTSEDGRRRERPDTADTGLIETARILHAGGSDLGELRYYAALYGEEDLSRELKRLDVGLSAQRLQLIAGTGISSDDPERTYFEDTLFSLDDAAAARAMRLLAQETADATVRIREQTFDEAMDCRGGAPLFTQGRFDAALQYTNLLSVFSVQDVASAAAEAARPEALVTLLEFVRSAPQKKSVIDAALEAADDPHTAAAILHQVPQMPGRQNRSDFDFEDDPLSEGVLGRVWSYVPASSTGICITEYKGTSPYVVIPPRIGARSVEFLTGSLFSRCRDELRTVHFPGTLRDIPAFVLDGAENLEEITIADGVPVIGEGAFMDCAGTSVVLPDSVTAIGARAFQNCASVRLPRLPRKLRTLGKAAFENCVQIDVPMAGTNLHSISERAFAGTGIREVYVPETITDVGPEAFTGCSSLSYVRLSAGTAVGPKAFFGCTQLNELKVSPDRTRLGPRAFGSTGLTKIILPDGLADVGQGCFSLCPKLTEAHLPQTATTIPPHLYSGCTSLVKVHLPASLEVIGNAAFSKCMSLAEVHFPERLREIHHGAFSECSSLRRVYLPDGVRLDEEIFSGCVALAEVRLPADLTEIPPEDFADCISLRSVVIPPVVRSIGAYAFEGSGLRKVTIPAAVKTIGDGAFSGCSELREVVFEGTPRVGSGVFSGCAVLRTGHLRKA